MYFRLILVATFIATPAVALAENPVSYDIYAIPSKSIVDSVAGVSDRLAKDGMTTFYRQGHAVHATLYLTHYPAGAESELKRKVERIAGCTVPFPLDVDGIEVTASNWVFLHVDWSASLQRLADTVTLAAEPLRTRNLQPPGWMTAYPAKLPAFERYGSPNVFMQFEPHLSLLAEEHNPKLADFVAAAKIDPPQASGTVEGIGIGVTDAHGQIVRTVAEYPFAASAAGCSPAANL